MPTFPREARNCQSSIVNRQSEKPAVAIAFSLSVGIAFSVICHHYSFAGLVIGNMLLILAAFLALQHNRLRLSLMAVLAAISVGGFLLGVISRDGFSNSDLR